MDNPVKLFEKSLKKYKAFNNSSDIDQELLKVCTMAFMEWAKYSGEFFDFTNREIFQFQEQVGKNNIEKELKELGENNLIRAPYPITLAAVDLYEETAYVLLLWEIDDGVPYKTRMTKNLEINAHEFFKDKIVYFCCLYLTDIGPDEKLNMNLKRLFYPVASFICDPSSDKMFNFKRIHKADDEKKSAIECGQAYSAIMVGLHILRDKNVKTETFDPGEKFNKSRIRRGKLPHPRITKINAIKTLNSVDEETGKTVRMHRRRGHIRKLNNGEKIWVNACWVNWNENFQGYVQREKYVSSSYQN